MVSMAPMALYLRNTLKFYETKDSFLHKSREYLFVWNCRCLLRWIEHQNPLKCVLFQEIKTTEKNTFERNSKLHFLPQVSCQWGFDFIFLTIHSFSSFIQCFTKNSKFKSLFLKSEKKSEIKSNFLKTPSNWIASWFNVVLTQWFNLGSSLGVV